MKKFKFDVAATFAAVLVRHERSNSVSELEELRASLVLDVDAARASAVQSAIDLANARLDEFDARMAEVAERLPAFDAATSAEAAATAAHDQAAGADSLGTTDPKMALENANAIIVARAANIARKRELADIKASTWSPLQSAQALGWRDDTRLRAKVLEQTESLMNQAWSASAPEFASELGREQGLAANARQEIWYPIVEEHVRRAHAARVEKQRAKVEPLRRAGRELLADPEVATLALERAFAARRGGLASARTAARARAADLAINV